MTDGAITIPPDTPEDRPEEDSAKMRQILEGARGVFLKSGFDGASMGDIARAAGVSKGTLYVYFAGKQELFSALIADERRRAKREFRLDPSHEDVGADLRAYGRTLIAYVSRPRNIELVRTVIGTAEKFPAVGDGWYRDGPQLGIAHIRAYLEAQAAAGRLRIDDAAMAARQLQALLYAGIVNELLYGVRTAPDEAEIAQSVEEAVATFLARYGKSE